MKFTLFTVLLFVTFQTFAQDKPCAVNIKVIDGRFMYSEATLFEGTQKKTSVTFDESTVTVKIPRGEKTLLLKIENSNCHAYCSRAKRVRQLNKGDEKLLRNLIEKEILSIVTQVNACNVQ